MIAENAHKSSYDNDLMAEPPRKRLPVHAFLGLAIIGLAHLMLVATDNTFVGRYYTPLQWTGLILFLDGLRKRRCGRSLITDHPGEFAMLCVISVGSWAIFEWYNVALKNWRYIGLPENTLLRYSGYTWAFATISPGMFLIHETVSDLLPGQDTIDHPRLPDALFWSFTIFGGVCLVVPVLWPSTWMTPLVWMGFAFLLDPINGRMGERSILSEFFTGRLRSMPVFFLSGLVAGILWEFWNFWAHSKWEYDVPYLGHWKVFEMPVLGFLGFMPFIIESFAIYVFVRRLLPFPRKVRYLDRD